MKKQNTILSEDLRRAPIKFLNKIFHSAGNDFIPPYHRFERENMMEISWDGWKKLLRN